jgi:hypothetical protein
MFPLISRDLITMLKLFHGLFNVTVMCLFFYHARNGLLIRRARTAKAPLPLHAIKRHRRMGPVLAMMGGAGFFVGLCLVMLDSGKVFLYPSHLLTGLAIVLLLFSAYRVSKKIAGPAARERDLHYRLGLAILALYLVNVFLGVGVLL